MKNSETVIDKYISGFSAEVQKKLQQLRTIISKAAPKATETLGYGIPTFQLEGNLVHFAAYKNHLGFYPAPSAIKAFASELRNYGQSKGAIRFPIDKPLPLALISEIVKFRVIENTEKARSKTIKKRVKNSQDGTFTSLPAPAQKALESKGIKTPKQLSKYSEKTIMSLHGIGPSSLSLLRKILRDEGLGYKIDTKA